MSHPLINQLNILKARNVKLRDIINKLQQDKDSTIKQLEELLQQKDSTIKQLEELLQQKNEIFNEKKQITEELDKQNRKYTHIGDFIIYE